jgi:hypothetical protein
MDMTDTSRKNAMKTRGRPFKPGNTGRPKGARNRVTLVAEALLDGEAAALTRKAIDLALAGDSTALRLCLDRVLPPRRERPIHFRMPFLESAPDAVGAMAAITAAVAAGEVTAGEAAGLTLLVEGFVKALEAEDFDQRLRALEAKSCASRS